MHMCVYVCVREREGERRVVCCGSGGQRGGMEELRRVFPVETIKVGREAPQRKMLNFQAPGILFSTGLLTDLRMPF